MGPKRPSCVQRDKGSYKFASDPTGRIFNVQFSFVLVEGLGKAVSPFTTPTELMKARVWARLESWWKSSVRSDKVFVRWGDPVPSPA